MCRGVDGVDDTALLLLLLLPLVLVLVLVLPLVLVLLVLLLLLLLLLLPSLLLVSVGQSIDTRGISAHRESPQTFTCTASGGRGQLS